MIIFAQRHRSRGTPANDRLAVGGPSREQNGFCVSSHMGVMLQDKRFRLRRHQQAQTWICRSGVSGEQQRIPVRGGPAHPVTSPCCSSRGAPFVAGFRALLRLRGGAVGQTVWSVGAQVLLLQLQLLLLGCSAEAALLLLQGERRLEDQLGGLVSMKERRRLKENIQTSSSAQIKRELESWSVEATLNLLS